MNVSIVAFTSAGARLAIQLETALGQPCERFAPANHCPDAGCRPLTDSLSQWTRARFHDSQALVFVGAAGIAVRAVAPYVQDKRHDPAVVAVDETGRFVIPLLSGHLGGANDLARRLAAAIGAQCAVTTATDLHGLFAVDVFAKKNRLHIENMALAKEISAALLSGQPVGFDSTAPVHGPVPPELTGGNAEIGICVTADPRRAPFRRTLRLIPQRIALGIGCRRDVSPQETEQAVRRLLWRHGLEPWHLCCLASIDRKRWEPALTALSQAYRLPFLTFTARQLAAAPGNFSSSEFVRRQMGVGCVCERAAVLACQGRLIAAKETDGAIALALAQSEEDVYFD